MPSFMTDGILEQNVSVAAQNSYIGEDKDILPEQLEHTKALTHHRESITTSSSKTKEHGSMTLSGPNLNKLKRSALHDT